MNLEAGLVGHWPFAGDCRDHSSVAHESVCHSVDLRATGPSGKPRTAAQFSGTGAHIVVSKHPALAFGSADFAIAAHVCADDKDGDVIGDLVGKFDPRTRTGLNLAIVTNTGVTSTAQPNYRNVQFGIDCGTEPTWADCGRPGNAVLVEALTVFKERLYAGTLELGASEKGHVWRYEGGTDWSDLGSPDGSNGVASLAEFNGALYCGSGRYNPRGSCLGDAQNPTPGGKVYRYEPDGRWTDCGHPGAEDATPEEEHRPGWETGKADSADSLIVYRGQLYVTSQHRRGAFRYEGGRQWRHIGPDYRLLSFVVFRQKLYALGNGGPILRYEGDGEWADCGAPPQGAAQKYGQNYGAVVFSGNLYVGVWPGGEVWRYDGDRTWTNLGCAGYAREIMGMALYNGNAYLGTLPMANVWRLDGQRLGFVCNLDNTPTAYLRRVWSMAVYDGKLFAGTLPSGHVHSLEAGKLATYDHSFEPGWHHVAAVREGGRLRLYVDGKLKATSSGFRPDDYDLTNDAPLLIGFGTHNYFAGRMSDLRIYDRALGEREIAALAS